MSKKKLPLSLMMIRGGVGKSFCIKHYSWGVIKTKFPDMTRIKASSGQRTCRNLFLEAVEYAKTVIADREKKAAWQKRLRRRNGVYNTAVKAFMLQDKLARQLIMNALKNQTVREIIVGAALVVDLPQKENNYEANFTGPG